MDAYNSLDAYNRLDAYNKLDAIVIPTTMLSFPLIKQHIERLNRFVPYNINSFANINIKINIKINIDIVYLFDKKKDHRLESMIFEEYGKTGLLKYFNCIKFKYCNLNDKDNIYIRNRVKWREIVNKNKKPTLGWKSGPNCMFIYFINNFQEYRYSLLMETDCFPVRDSWLSYLCDLTRFSEKFWIKGSVYRGVTNIKPHNRYHINGNAIYATGDPTFIHFINNTFLPFFKKSLIDDPNLPYDFIINMYLTKCNNNNNNNNKCQKIIHKITYTNLIQNYGGTRDMQKVSDIVKTDIDHNVCLLHGKYLRYDI